MKKNESLSGSIGVLIAAAMWGTTGTAATFAPNVSPIAIGSAAMGIGGILQALLAANLIYAFRGMILMQGKSLLVGSVAIGIYPLAFYSSMKLIGVAAGTVITIGFAPLVSALLEWIIDKKINNEMDSRGNSRHNGYHAALFSKIRPSTPGGLNRYK